MKNSFKLNYDISPLPQSRLDEESAFSYDQENFIYPSASRFQGPTFNENIINEESFLG